MKRGTGATYEFVFQCEKCGRIRVFPRRVDEGGAERTARSTTLRHMPGKEGLVGTASQEQEVAQSGSSWNTKPLGLERAPGALHFYFKC
jgi:hypothetical protein